jgi:hypothetical protein
VSFLSVPPNLASDLTVGPPTKDGATISWTKTIGSFSSYEITYAPIEAGVVIPTVATSADSPKAKFTNMKSGKTYKVFVRTKIGISLGAKKEIGFTTCKLLFVLMTNY